MIHGSTCVFASHTTIFDTLSLLFSAHLCLFKHRYEHGVGLCPISLSPPVPRSIAATTSPRNRIMAVTAGPTLNDLLLHDVNRHDIWDRRESAVGNAHVWKSFCDQYKSSKHFHDGIPHKIHQIWIGTRQPPCVWLDTWRVDFMTAFEKSPASEDWSYKLWDNQSVRGMPMLNRELYDAESAPQCQADILRLEVLYQYGGVYIDADIVSTVKDLRPVLKQAKDTGFIITYEPDTKDKPYSVLGNSIIACTPKHPLILMLMSYIKQIYAFKRAHYGVEWVTGPLTYTKVLVHTDMPITVPPSKDFYPAFHYVPNPSAIDVTSLDSYCFQFGYTCSGLSQWVAENNKCKQAHDCSYHANVEYPLGKLRQFPKKNLVPDTKATIPQVIHQFAFQENKQPVRWTSTWKDGFCPANGFRYESWSWQRLKDEIGSFYCANLYDKNRLDSFSLKMLALEILEKKGGYYIPLSTIFVGDKDDPEAESAVFGDGTGIFERGSVRGSAAGNCLPIIKESYDTGSVAEADDSLPIAYVSDMRHGDDVAATAEYKDGSRFLGAGEIYYFPKGESESRLVFSAHAALTWAYDCQVPIYRYPKEAQVISRIRESNKRLIVITDEQFGLFSSLVNELPGVMYRLDQEGKEWDFILFSMEWEVDGGGLDVYQASSPFKPPTARYLGFIANEGVSKTLSSISIEDILGRVDSGRIFVASEKSRHSAKLASIFRTMGSIEGASRTLTGFTPNFHRDNDEVHDNLFKGFRDGQLAFEVQIDDEQRVMFRSWNGGCIDCECRVQADMNGLSVDFLRIYSDGQVEHDITGAYVR